MKLQPHVSKACIVCVCGWVCLFCMCVCVCVYVAGCACFVCVCVCVTMFETFLATQGSTHKFPPLSHAANKLLSARVTTVAAQLASA